MGAVDMGSSSSEGIVIWANAVAPNGLMDRELIGGQYTREARRAGDDQDDISARRSVRWSAEYRQIGREHRDNLEPSSRWRRE